MYIAVPGKTGFLGVRIETTSFVAKPAQKPAAPKPKTAVTHRCGYACSCKNMHPEFSNKDPKHVNNRIGQERRKCTHSHLGRRGRRAVVIFH